MEYTVASNELSKCIKTLGKFCGNFETLGMKFQNGSLWIFAVGSTAEARVKVPAEGAGKFNCAVDTQIIINLCYGKNQNLNFSMKDNALKFSSIDKSESSISGFINTLEFIDIRGIPKEILKYSKEIDIFSILENVALKTQFGFEPPNSILSRSKNLTIAATADFGHIAILRQDSGGEDFEIKIPANYARTAISGFGNTRINMSADNNGIYLWDDNKQLALPLLEITVVELSEMLDLIEKPALKVELTTREFIEAVVKINKISDERTLVEFNKNSVSFSASNDLGNIVINIPAKINKPASIRINPKYLLDCAELIKKYTKERTMILSISESFLGIEIVEKSQVYNYAIIGVT